MQCSKCCKEKSTPVIFKDSPYCIARAAGVLEEEHERELQAIKIRDKIVETTEELKVIDAKIALDKLERETLEKRLAELNEVIDSKSALLHRLDKLEAELKGFETGSQKIAAFGV
jgi:ABC-type phosphate transport system auxiliary subunit